ncbi:hypothetical protein AcW1_009053 [Taiwanofungus camphoratus]|nr:hypothetical protein AcV5_007075 [Antrodia cinnamomea]KAI0949436.1 hypothetical protein AcW1_009053 [Antrodia cinnamomea]
MAYALFGLIMDTLRLCTRLAKPLRSSVWRCYSTSTAIPPLPPPAEWRSLFASHTNFSKERVSVCNPETAARIAESFLCGESPTAGEGKIIIEAFPGPGALSRALLELPRSTIRKLIILEDHEAYLEHLRPLEAADSRVKVVPLSGFDWDTYTHIEDAGLMEDVESASWESGLHPQLHFISHLQHTIQGEQLIAQLYRCIPDQSWLYKFGRVPMSFILSDWVWNRLSAKPHTRHRCKVSVIAEATATSELSLPPKSLLPYDDHFHPVTAKSGVSERRPESRRPGHPLVSINIVPHADQFITKGMLDKWDYCLRRLFVLKSTPLKRAISSLAPGAQTLLKVLTSPNLPPEQQLDVNKPPRDLTIADWALIIRAFDNWPFAPEDLLISDAFSKVNAMRLTI